MAGVIYMQARTYLPAYGKFAQVDPAYDQTKDDPETWNLYSYVANNPVTHADPDGRSADVTVTKNENEDSPKKGDIKVEAGFKISVSKRFFGVDKTIQEKRMKMLAGKIQNHLNNKLNNGGKGWDVGDPKENEKY